MGSQVVGRLVCSPAYRFSKLQSGAAVGNVLSRVHFEWDAAIATGIDEGVPINPAITRQPKTMDAGSTA